MGWIAYVNSLKKTLRNFLVIYALFDVWCGWGLGGAAASLPGFAVKNSKTGLRGGCASMTWPISQISWYIFMYMAMSWYAFQVLVLIFTFFHLICFFPCTFFVCLSPFSYCTTVICNMATNKWYIIATHFYYLGIQIQCSTLLSTMYQGWICDNIRPQSETNSTTYKQSVSFNVHLIL